jgi:hypothetical protein
VSGLRLAAPDEHGTPERVRNHQEIEHGEAGPFKQFQGLDEGR